MYRPICFKVETLTAKRCFWILMEWVWWDLREPPASTSDRQITTVSYALQWSGATAALQRKRQRSHSQEPSPLLSLLLPLAIRRILANGRRAKVTSSSGPLGSQRKPVWQPLPVMGHLCFTYTYMNYRHCYWVAWRRWWPHSQHSSRTFNLLVHVFNYDSWVHLVAICPLLPLPKMTVFSNALGLLMKCATW